MAFDILQSEHYNERFSDFSGMAICNLACTYSKLGMHRDALVLHQQVLALYPSHP
jgi:hypothetical protein